MTRDSGRDLALSLFVALVACLAFLPGLPGEFVFDDLPNISTNEAIQLTELSTEALARVVSTPQLSGTTRALPTLSFALDYWRSGGADPLAFKVTNIALHAATAFALVWLFRSLLLVAGVPAARTRWLAPVLALAWALHPLQVSSVLYAVQRIQAMGTFFLVLALLAYLHARRAQIAGGSGRTGLLGTGLLWAMALGCKEDSALLPAYTLALELTVLGFAAADARTARLFRRGYLALAIAGTAAYFLLAIPHFWQWEAYDGRDYSTIERLLTQPRMLCMYLGQILVPWPPHMPFYYDWVQPSRGLLQPWTTLPALALVTALLAGAWRARTRYPLFSLGVFLFFAAHFIASNVPNLELAFEHRNHFALVGAVLAIGSILAGISDRIGLGQAGRAAACTVVLSLLAGTTLLRADTWASNADIARLATEQAPASGRAWTLLCATRFAEGGGAVAGNPALDEAIDTCARGVASAPQSAGSHTLLVALKSFRGDVTAEDWTQLRSRLQTVYMTRDNARSYLTLTYHARHGVPLDRQELLSTLEVYASRDVLDPFSLASLGYFVMNDLADPERATLFFARAIGELHPADPFPAQLAAELREKGEPELAERVEEIGRMRGQTAP